MAWQLANSFLRGRLDARTPGQLTGSLWLSGLARPVELHLEGRAAEDVAGRVVTLSHPYPRLDADPLPLAARQEGWLLEFTSSHKASVPAVDVAEVVRLQRAGLEVPMTTRNETRLVWVSRASGEVSLCLPDLRITATAVVPATRSPPPTPRRPPAPAAAGGEQPFDEFAWERLLKHSDAVCQQYAELMENLRDHPERDRLVALAMGWTARSEADPDPGGPPPSPGTWVDAGELRAPEPDPGREGRDWIRVGHGEIVHPVAHRAFLLASETARFLKTLPDPVQRDPDVLSFRFNLQSLAAKLAGGLNNLAYDDAPDGGFVVAYLKRALAYLNQTLYAADLVSRQPGVPPAWLAAFRSPCLGLREAVLELIQTYRTGSGR